MNGRAKILLIYIIIYIVHSEISEIAALYMLKPLGNSRVVHDKTILQSIFSAKRYVKKRAFSLRLRY